MTAEDCGSVELGIGTGRVDSETTFDVVRAALKTGYRHVDTAEAYGTEKAVKRALDASSVDREDVFLSTKLHSSNLSCADVLAHGRNCRQRLSVDSIDLLSVHWPAHTFDVDETLEGFSMLRSEGVIRNIGMCNITPDLLVEVDERLNGSLAAVQVELHPMLQQRTLVESARDRDVTVIAHTPLAQGDAIDLPEVEEVATRHGVSEAQVCLAWILEREGVWATVGAREDHIREDFHSHCVELTTEDVALIASVDRRKRYVNYDFAPWNN